MSKIIIIGGTGLIGSTVVSRLNEHGHEAVSASPSSGVDTFTGTGLDRVLDGAEVVVDVSNSPSFDDGAALEFFTRSTTNLLAAEKAAGVRHHVALSVVGTERLQESGYFRAKLAQETIIRNGGVPFSIVHATQFFEFAKKIADAATDGDVVRLSPALIRPMAANDVASAVGRTAAGEPVNGIREVAGPEEFGLDELIRTAFRARGISREVITDPTAPYFNALLEATTLLPGDAAILFDTRFEDWLAQTAPPRVA